MITNWIIIGFGFFSLASLLYFEYKNFFPGKAVAKTFAALSFLAFGFTQGIQSSYGLWIWGGLILSFWGDIFLIPKSRFSFFVGLLSFLLGHVAYSVAFWNMAVFGRLEIAFAIIPIVMGVIFFIWIRSYLGKFRIPVILYLIAIHFMLVSGMGMQGNEFLGRETGFALGGALLFYFSDFAVARERFVQKSFFNKLWGLPFYFIGQFLIAYSMKFF